jgi:hypothetical protein
MMNRVFRSRMIPIAVIFLLIVLPQLMKKYNDVISTEIPTILDVLLFTIFLTASVIYTTMFVNSQSDTENSAEEIFDEINLLCLIIL